MQHISATLRAVIEHLLQYVSLTIFPPDKPFTEKDVLWKLTDNSTRSVSNPFKASAPSDLVVACCLPQKKFFTSIQSF